MDKNKKIIFAVSGLVLLILFLDIIGALSSLNGLIKQEPDTSCNIDADCALVAKVPSCGHGCPSCGTFDYNQSSVAINSGWKPFCFEEGYTYFCTACAGKIINKDKVKAACINHKCERVPV